ncbi:MerR family transcriptional regulator [Tropheryma whipplei]|uniref:transcriptional regulator FtsR n=1 Tax=Tropheryma whipplei TaxID=2039 RepID=UPI0004BA323B|nr:MerR family transcriptional regulator [Tropheryma whipplei]
MSSAQEKTDRPFTIGQVLSILKKEFPDVTSSKLRFLEEQKLIIPPRTSAGYRVFYPADVKRIRVILRMQRDEYLPLKIIRSRLDSANIALSTTSGVSMRREELVSRAGVPATLFTEAVTHSLIKPSECYGQDTLKLLVCLAALKKMGISPKHLTFLKKTVDKEYLLSHNAVLPLRVRKDEGLLEHSFCELLNNMQAIQAILVSQVKKDFLQSSKSKIDPKDLASS